MPTPTLRKPKHHPITRALAMMDNSSVPTVCDEAGLNYVYATINFGIPEGSATGNSISDERAAQLAMDTLCSGDRHEDAFIFDGFLTSALFEHVISDMKGDLSNPRDVAMNLNQVLVFHRFRNVDPEFIDIMREVNRYVSFRGGDEYLREEFPNPVDYTGWKKSKIAEDQLRRRCMAIIHDIVTINS